MGLWDSIKAKAQSEYENVSELQQRAAEMDNRNLCRSLQYGTRAVMGYGPELKQRLEDMSDSEKKDLFDYCMEHSLYLAANTIKRSRER